MYKRQIYDLGYTMDEIMSNGERTQEFMNQIFDMASEEFGTDFNSGIKDVYKRQQHPGIKIKNKKH